MSEVAAYSEGALHHERHRVQTAVRIKPRW